MVSIENNCRKIVTCWSRDNYLLSTSLEVSRSLLLRCVETCTLENYVYVVSSPWAVSSVHLSRDLNLLTINDDRILSSLYSVLTLTELASETTLSGIILQQMSKHLRTCQVVDCNNLITFSLKHLTECETTDTAKAVNSYIYHFLP